MISNSSPATYKYALFEQNVVMDMRIREETLVTRLVIRQSWIDARFFWMDDCRFKDIELLHVNIDKLWRPDIAVHNNVDGTYISSSASDFQAVVFSNGTVLHSHIGKYSTFCRVNVRNFPYDEQVCSIDFHPFVYSGEDVKLRSGEVMRKNLKPNVEWELKRATTEYIGILLDSCRL